MSKKPKHRNDEPIYEYVSRLTDYIYENQLSRNQIHDVLHGLAVESYIAGSNMSINTAKKLTDKLDNYGKDTRQNHQGDQ